MSEKVKCFKLGDNRYRVVRTLPERVFITCKFDKIFSSTLVTCLENDTTNT